MKSVNSAQENKKTRKLLPPQATLKKEEKKNFPSLHFLKGQGPVSSEEKETFLPFLYTH